jgi:hypothetical protein
MVPALLVRVIAQPHAGLTQPVPFRLLHISKKNEHPLIESLVQVMRLGKSSPTEHEVFPHKQLEAR